MPAIGGPATASRVDIKGVIWSEATHVVVAARRPLGELSWSAYSSHWA